MAVIKAEGVSIRYMTGDFKDIGIKEYVIRRLTGNYCVKEFWADWDVNFELNDNKVLFTFVSLCFYVCLKDY